jgi:MFS transporter, DHA1 family, multidrug resistance protein
MFNNLGIQWAGTLLGCLAAIMIPIPIAFVIYGPRLRQKSKYAPSEGPGLGLGDEEKAGS